jgi:hypothetical protein
VTLASICGNGNTVALPFAESVASVNTTWVRK